MKKYKTLIVEDDIELAELVAEFLNRYEFVCTMVSTGAEAIDIINKQPPELILLDIMLPDTDGNTIFRKIQKNYFGKVIMLSALTDTIDQVLGLELGADDYITKPIEPRLLLAHIRAVMRRDIRKAEVSAETQPKESFEQNGVSIDLKSGQAFVANKSVSLSTSEFELLALFLSRPGEIISRDEFFMHLKGTEYDGQNRHVDIIISQLRAKIEKNNNEISLIKTIRNKGYLFLK